MGRPVLGSTAGGAPGPFWTGAAPSEMVRKKMAARLCKYSLDFMVELVSSFSVHSALAQTGQNASENLSPGVLFQRFQKHFPNFNFAAFA
jgi:hypothetical protein